MSFVVKMYLGDEVYNVLDYKVNFRQEIDYNGKPCAKSGGCKINVVIESTQNPQLIEWMCTPDLMQKVKLEISPAFTFGKSRVIDILDAYCVEYQDIFEHSSREPMKTQITISPAIYKEGSVVFNEYWKVTDLNRKTDVTDDAVDNEPKIIDYYITDLTNKRIEQAKPGDKILLNVHTKNLLGKLLSINLDDKTVDFKYNGEVLVNDTLTNYEINANLEKIELEVVKEGA